MPSGFTRYDFAGEVLIEVRIDGACNMRLFVGAPPVLQVVQFEAAVDDGPIGIVQVEAQVAGRDECGIAHGSSIPDSSGGETRSGGKNLAEALRSEIIGLG